MAKPFHIRYLTNDLKARQTQNGRYSMRAYAQRLGIDPGLLSKIMAEKRKLSLKSAQKIMDQLEVDEATTSQFMNSVLKTSLEKYSLAPQKNISSRKFEIEEQSFEQICNLVHYSILELSETKNFEKHPKKIARRLGITEIEVRQAIANLLKLGLVDQEEWRKVPEALTTANKKQTSSSLKKHQKEVLKASTEALISVPIEQRCHTSMTLACNPKQIEIAREKIGDFLNELCKEMQVGDQTEVYQIAVNLFPITKLK